MTIPERALVVTVDPKDMTLDEMVLFSVKGFDIYDFRQWLIDNTEWTAEEIGKIKLRELEQVAIQIGEAVKAKAVPLAN